MFSKRRTAWWPYVGLFLTVAAVTLSLAPSAVAATFTVNSTGDEFDNGSVRDTHCDTDGGTNDSPCTLRAAIQEASDATINPGPNTIDFDPSVFTGDASTSTIAAANGPSPGIGDGVTIDGGDCDATAAFKPCVGFQAGGGQLGLIAPGDNVEIRGLAITNGATGLTIGSGATNAKVAGNWFGLRLDETAQGNGRGVELASNVDAGNDQNTVGGETAADRNVFAHNTADGLRISGGDGNTIKGNYFGTKPDGTTAAPNGTVAGTDNIEISAVGGIANLARSNTIGGTLNSAQLASPECDGPCNVIANSSDGIDLETEGGTDGSGPGPTTIKGNFIGLDKTGQAGAGNTNQGIRAGLTDSINRPLTVGGPDPGDRNVISGANRGLFTGGGATVRNNYFGSNSQGDEAIPNMVGDARVGTNDDPPTSTVQDNRFVGDGTFGASLILAGGTEVVGNTFGIGTGGETLAPSSTAIVVTENFDVIGGPNAGDANTIGNVPGVSPAVSISGGNENVLRGNLIGVTANGTAVPNGGAGISVINSSTNTAINNTIGGDTIQEENVISNSGHDAIEIVDNDSPTPINNSGNQVLRNTGSNNGDFPGDLFIDLRTQDVSTDGPGNPPDGPNAGIQAPSLDEPTTTGMTGDGNQDNEVRVFKTFDEGAHDVRGFVDADTVGAGGTWAATFSPSLPTGQCLSATQTNTDPSPSGGTSELATPALSIGTGFCDVTGPTTAIGSGPSGPTNDPTADFGFSSESGATFECRVDQGQFGSCTDSTGPNGTHTTSSLTNGPHTFRVRATDAVDNTGPVATRSFTVDTTAPQTTINSGPAQGATIADPTPTFGFGSEADATFQCKVDGGSFAACTSPKTTTALGDGSHTFQVRARDAAGNPDPSPASRTFTVETTGPPPSADTDPPETTIDKGPKKKSHKRKAKVRFSADEGSTFECKLDKKDFAPCESPFKHKVKPRKHRFQVRAIDQAGNADPTPAKLKFKVLD